MSPSRRDPQLDAERFGAAAQHLDRLRKAAIGHEERPPSSPRFFACTRCSSVIASAGGGPFVEERRVGHLHPRQIRDHRLEVEERLEAALRDLGLIGRVGRVPARVLEQARSRITLGVSVS